METKKPAHVSLELLRELELQQDAEHSAEEFSDLAAEQELDFNKYVEREYQPELWEELENDDDSTGGTSDEVDG